MQKEKREHPKEKAGLHERNKHRNRYDFKQLIASCAALAEFVATNEYGDESIDFFNPLAVKTLNKALLQHFYGINYWEIPPHYLCPPIPGRAEYIHHIADLLYKKTPRSAQIRCLDIGVGANCVYPIIGSVDYGWQFVGSDIDKIAIQSATEIVSRNEVLRGKIELRLQTNSKDVFRGIIKAGEKFDVTICNPPFHASAAEAQRSTVKKLTNLKQGPIQEISRNFGGQQNELWCEGGEEEFVKTMIEQSTQFASSCGWFSSLISKSTYLDSAYRALERTRATEVRCIELGHGNKINRILVWSFLK